MLKFHVAPADQGQAVEVAYGSWDGICYKRVHDRCDGTTKYYQSRCLAGDEGDYWNARPKNKRWKLMDSDPTALYADKGEVARG